MKFRGGVSSYLFFVQDKSLTQQSYLILPCRLSFAHHITLQEAYHFIESRVLIATLPVPERRSSPNSHVSPVPTPPSPDHQPGDDAPRVAAEDGLDL